MYKLSKRQLIIRFFKSANSVFGVSKFIITPFPSILSALGTKSENGVYSVRTDLSPKRITFLPIL